MLSQKLLSTMLICCSATTLIGGAHLPSQQSQPTYPPYQPITNNYYTSQATASSNPTMVSSQTSCMDVHHLVEHRINIKCPDIHLPTMTCMVDNITTATSSIQSWLWNNKWNIAAVALIYTYTKEFYRLQQINHMLQQSYVWCAWKEITPLGHLVASPSNDLLQQLQIDIHKKYYQSLDAQNAQSVHALFLQDTNEEMVQLNTYLSMYEFYQTIHMHKLLPFKYSPAIIQERKARLQFVIDLFIKWYLQQ